MKKNNQQEVQKNNQQEVKQEVTAVTTNTTNSNGTDIITYTKNKFSAENFGFESSALERGVNGGMIVTLKAEDGSRVEKEVFVEDTSAYEAVNAYAALKDFKELSDVAKCYYIYKAAPLSVAAGFKSVGAFLAEQFGIDSSTANNYRLIGELFLTEEECKDEQGNVVYDEQGNATSKIVWSRPWLDKTPIGNLNQCLSIVRKCKDEDGNIDIDLFFEQYVKTGKLALDAKQKPFKEMCTKITGNDKKTTKQQEGQKDNKPESPKQTVAAMWATVKETLYAYDLSEQELQLMETASKSIEQIMEAHKAKH